MTKNYFTKVLLLLIGLSPMITMATTTTVAVSSNAYTPANITINLGDTVFFQWVGGNHPTVSDDNTTIPSFPMNSANQTKIVVLTSVGVVPYYCIAHGSIGGVGMAGVITVNAAPVSGALFTEDFIYTAGTTLVSNGYNASGTPPSTVNLQTVSSSGLNFAGSPSANVGNALNLLPTGEDVNKSFTASAITSGTVYASMFVRIDTARVGGDYFFHFAPTPIGTEFRGRVFVKSSGAGLQFGISKSGNETVAVFDPTLYTLGTTYLLVVKYSIIAGATNDEVKLFVNPTLGGTEPAISNATALLTETDATAISSIGIRQGTNSKSANLVLDGIRVGTTYADVTPGSGVSLDPTVSFAPVTNSVSEGLANFNINVTIANPNANGTAVQVVLTGGTATDGTDFTFTSPQTVTFPASSSANQTVSVAIIDDLIGESLETITFVLRNSTNNATIGADSVFTLSIIDNDIPVPPTGFLEDFSYTAGTTLLSNAYNASGTPPSTLNPQTVTTGGLSFAGSPSAGVGNAVILKTFGEDVNKNFRTDSLVSGNVYASMFVKIDTAKTGDYFFHLGPNPIGIEFRGRVFVKSSGAGIQFGVSKSTGAATAVYSPTVYNLGTTYLLVLKYAFVAGVTNDEVNLFVNPVLGQPEPATSSATAVVSEADATELATFGLRQGTTASSPFLTIDGIRIATNFEAVTPGSGVVPVNPIVKFASAGISISESALMANLPIDISGANTSATSVTVSVKTTGTTATAGTDYTFTTSTVTFPASSSAQQIVMATIINDAITEGAETIVFRLSNATNNSSIGADSIFTVTINDDDLPALAVTPIATLRINDANGNPTFPLTTRVRVRGMVYGINLRPAGLQITIIDQTAGIGVFEGAANLGYTALEGDSIEVFGVLSPFNGLNQINPDSIKFISSGNPVKTPTIVTALSETTESDLIQFNGYTIVNPATWGVGTSGFTAKFNNGLDTIDVRVDADVTALFTAPVPVGAQTIIGIGGQFDSSDPKNSGYQILPRRLSDVSPTSGITNLSRTEVLIYPNPTNDLLNIKTNEPIVNLTMVNMLGQMVYNSTNASNILQISTANFAKGIYVVKVQTAKGVRTEKIKVN